MFWLVEIFMYILPDLVRMAIKLWAWLQATPLARVGAHAPIMAHLWWSKCLISLFQNELALIWCWLLKPISKLQNGRSQTNGWCYEDSAHLVNGWKRHWMQDRNSAAVAATGYYSHSGWKSCLSAYGKWKMCFLFQDTRAPRARI